MEEKNFVHLHMHTAYSFLDGAISLDKLFNKVKDCGMKAVAITDHGAMFGTIDFYRKALKYGIKPILGCEVYVAPDSRFNKEYEKSEDKNYHLILLAENNQGLKNLQILVSKAFLEGFYYKPRIDKELLKDYSSGLICLSACLAGELPRSILRDGLEKSIEKAKEYEDIFGKGNFYLEIQDNGLAEQKIVNNNIIEISKKTGIPIVATNDCHFLNREDYMSHRILMCVQMQNTLSNSKNNNMGHTEELYVKTPKEMWDSFGSIPQALHNTLDIAERCEASFRFGDLKLPQYDVPKGYDSNSYLEYLANEGLKERLRNIPEEKHSKYYDRLKEELEVIKYKGYSGYYLIVWDFIKYAKNNNIPVGPGRGSGAGSLTAYALKITDIDPIRFNLLFERFLNPERKSMPDFDVDFCMNKRDLVIDYVKNKYGQDRVSQIVVFSTLKARAALRDVGRVLEIPLNTVDKLAKMIPFSPNMTLEKAIKIDPSIEESIKAVPKGDELLRHTLNLEGLYRQTGMHAGGIVISDEPLVEYVPLCKGVNDEMLTQYEKDTLELIGLVKFDFLGLKNLTIIDEALCLIRKKYNAKINIQDLPTNDKKTYDILSSGETTGVFQLESSGMRSLLKKLNPTCFEDIIAVLALYRPGPIGSGMLDDFIQRKHGKQKIDYFFPELENILKETYGIIVYQEQVMQIAQKIAGYSLGSADLLRRAMGKKKPEEMKKHRNIFLYGSDELGIPGAIKKGYDKKKAEKLFNLMEIFAEYGFNKSHSAAYAMLAYQTAYLKAHYPVCYMAALLSCELEKGEKIEFLIEECKRVNIDVLPPDINESFKDFVAYKDSIRFGLSAIKNVGTKAIEDIIKKREKDGSFKSIYDFCKRVDIYQCNKKVVESLIKAGAFDSFGKTRKALLQVLDKALEEGQNKQKFKNQGVTITIDELLEDIEGEKEETYEYYPDVGEMPETELLRFEKEVLGFYISKHPFSLYSKILEGITTSIKQLKDSADENIVTTSGMIKSIRYHITKNNEKMAFVTLEDIEDSVNVVIFPKLLEKVISIINEDNIVVVKGKLSVNEEEFSILADELFSVDTGISKLVQSFTIVLDENTMPETIQKLKQLVVRYKGPIPLSFKICSSKGYTVEIATSKEYSIKLDINFLYKLKGIIKKDNYFLEIKNNEVKKNGSSFNYSYV
ncbi:MAG: DNA polymerase III subunit alpha [Deferribacterota bacterium]|nr:DNA polymerase III subunit alpha [Deferribacterota bacterium]